MNSLLYPNIRSTLTSFQEHTSNGGGRSEVNSLETLYFSVGWHHLFSVASWVHGFIVLSSDFRLKSYRQTEKFNARHSFGNIEPFFQITDILALL